MIAERNILRTAPKWVFFAHNVGVGLNEAGGG